MYCHEYRNDDNNDNVDDKIDSGNSNNTWMFLELRGERRRFIEQKKIFLRKVDVCINTTLSSCMGTSDKTDCIYIYYMIFTL